MLFFLSKLLPAMFSPLGLVCIALVLSVIAQIRHRPRIAIAGTPTELTILSLLANPIVEHVLGRE